MGLPLAAVASCSPMALSPVRIPDGVRATIADHIARADGCELFFTATTDDGGDILSVELLARGHTRAVPAITRDLQPGQVVLHNHPSGELTPSDPDIEIASMLGERGVGFVIVDNQVRHDLTVTRPHRPPPERPVEAAWIERFFAADGPLARRFAAYEPRPPQVAMAKAAAEVINQARPRLVEAGTGTGKSLAYLVPAARWAQVNQKRVVIATHTIHLQQQLVTKDIPQLAEALDAPLKAVLVKGRSNYLCLRKLNEAAAQPDLLDEEEQRHIEALVAWSRVTGDGSLADLPEPPPMAVWERVASDADATLRARCPHFDRCFFYRARRDAASAHLLIANHALLSADLAVRLASGDPEVAAVLPPYHRVVIDEAHHLEDSAVRHLGTQTSRLALLRALGRLHRARGGTLLARLARAVAKLPPFEEQAGLRAEAEERLPKRIDEARDLARAAFDALATLLLPDPILSSCDLDAEASAHLRPESDRILKELASTLTGTAREVHRLLKQCAALPPTLADALASPLTDCAGAVNRLQLVADALLTCTGPRPENRVRWVERRRTNLILFSLPVELRGELAEALFRPFPGTLLTSATLSTGNDCAFVADRLGLGEEEPAPLAPLVLPSPFDHATQLRCLCPTDLPEVNQPRFDTAASELIARIARRLGGRTLVLTTAFRQVRSLSLALRDALAPEITVLAQGEQDRHRLLERFRTDTGFLLIATDSFWEGIDVVGPALSAVVITRLPFRVPDDPLEQARTEALRARGRHPFAHYSVPIAILKLRQGVGRLIRSRTDRGEVWILDHRLVRKSYGSRFRKALPVAVEAGDAATLLARLEEEMAARR